jgi:hypothetical protein
MPNQWTGPAPIETRFWSKVTKTPTCWLWKRAHHNFGYGTFYDGRRLQKAHRVSYEFTHGPIPDGLCVLHRCDNPACVRPDHLFVGTRTDNNRDMTAKGRHTRIACHLTPAQVQEIRRRYAAGGISQRRLADEYGVVQQTVGDILTGRTWRGLS